METIYGGRWRCTTCAKANTGYRECDHAGIKAYEPCNPTMAYLERKPYFDFWDAHETLPWRERWAMFRAYSQLRGCDPELWQITCDMTLG